MRWSYTETQVISKQTMTQPSQSMPTTAEVARQHFSGQPVDHSGQAQQTQNPPAHVPQSAQLFQPQIYTQAQIPHFSQPQIYTQPQVPQSFQVFRRRNTSSRYKCALCGRGGHIAQFCKARPITRTAVQDVPAVPAQPTAASLPAAQASETRLMVFAVFLVLGSLIVSKVIFSK